MTPQEILSAGRLMARVKAPYFRTVLVGLAVVEAPGLGTIGVTAKGVLLVDWDFIARVTPAQMAGLLVHEVMHIVLRHHDRRGKCDPALDNKAGDLAINPAVIDMGLELPGGELAGLFPEAFGWERGLTKDEYYELLRQEEAGRKQGGSSEDSGAGDKPHAGGGWCGSCAGRALPNEPKDGDGSEASAAQRSDAEMERMVRTVAEAVREHSSKNPGSVPGGLARWASEALRPPVVPWQTKLARLARRAVAWRPGAVDYRYDGPGRRQAGLGYGNGKPVLPRLRCPVPRVAVVVDTSGSMGRAELTAAVRESAGVMRAVGAEVDFVACDAAVHSLRSVSRWQDLPKLLKGGGGTDLIPAFAALDTRRPRPEVVIFITDGFGPAPAAPPRGMKVVWVLVGRYVTTPASWGECLTIPAEGAEEAA